MQKTRLSSFALATLIGCVGNRTPLVDPHPAKPDTSLPPRDAGIDRQADSSSLDVRPMVPDLAPDLLRFDGSADSGPDRAVDLATPDTRSLIPDLATPDLRLPDARPLSPDLAPDRTQDSWVRDLRPFAPDSASDRPLDSPEIDAPGPDLPSMDGTSLDLASDPASDRLADVSGVDAGSGDAGPDSGPDAGDTMAGCQPGTRYVLALGLDYRLYRFDPASLSLTDIAEVTCGEAGLNSLTASPSGAAFISNTIGQLCTLDVKTFKTTLTAFDPNVLGNFGYGMALLRDSSPAGQALFVGVNSPDVELKAINLTSYTLGDIGVIAPAISMAELTAGPNDGLYALSPGQPSSLLHLDPLTAGATEVVTLPNDGSSGGFALVYWEDSFYLFLGDPVVAGTNNVYRYRPSDGQTTLVGTLPVQLIGAGVALCQ